MHQPSLLDSACRMSARFGAEATIVTISNAVNPTAVSRILVWACCSTCVGVQQKKQTKQRRGARRLLYGTDPLLSVTLRNRFRPQPLRRLRYRQIAEIITSPRVRGDSASISQ